ncbi:MAG: hypothetical protein JNM52_02355 [Betaproteobacteria bacterium]|nr:hypothetical protein [Betaproteobacteria bacterium]
MSKWTKFPHEQTDITYLGDTLKKNWAALHKGDTEPYPKDANLQEAWRQYHAGNFAEAAVLGRDHVVAARATAIYATYLEKREPAKIKLFMEAMELADTLRNENAQDINAHYQYAYAAGRYSQSISVIKALKDGYGGKIKAALEAVLKLNDKHAEAHTAMGAYHAEIIDKVGALVGKLTYGANKDVAITHYEKAIKLTPQSPIAHIEYANGLLMLFGDKEMDRATQLYEKAAQMTPRDAMEVLDIEMAKEELA